MLLTGGFAMATTIPSQAKDIVTFIFIKTPDGKLIPNGTGFFVGIKSEQNAKRSFGYLVTAKHVLQDDKRQYYDSAYIRLNKKDGGSKFIKIPIKENSTVFSHHDPNVDIAVIPAFPDASIFDFKILPEEMLTTKELFEKNHIREGDEIFFTGLFTGHVGAKKNYPIVRFGRVAMLTDEKIDWDGESLDLYLVETQSFGGNSGAPVFFDLGALRDPNVIRFGGSQLFLAGVMKGSFNRGNPIKVIQTDAISLAYENVGIAAVVPAYKLYEILFSDKLKSLRNPPQPLPVSPPISVQQQESSGNI